MKVYSVFDKEFSRYGQVIMGLNCNELINKMQTIPMPESGVSYLPSIEELENCSVMDDFKNVLFGGMPAQLGMCWGYNTKLNCLEYHRDSEFNLGSTDFILLLGKREELEDYILDTATVKAFRVPAHVLIEVFSTTLHYAPCHCSEEIGFRVLVGLPKGTNTVAPKRNSFGVEDKYLTACNKWLFAHADSAEAKSGAIVALKGKNIDITDSI